ncbi:GNAT family N-acetyltransferase [Flavivirga spongiicola]|uniref:GNAT family N-acetyltransferase n=1 Tax=Flavivirga spongiicola TaxID=421621 RepID=A0ABU7XV91_9FLAO|nr:GNAT family N-acetyltransferase [Flavivirga sp. MEBiC05379]MDO5979350.1 GNAT family N-acetyltransferase [Flavivirga sp. MEBiC05379]
MIEVKKYSELLEQTKDKLNAFIKGEFGHIPIVNEMEWAIPDWTIIFYENDQIATFYNIIETHIRIDNKIFKVAGINNVITPKKFRKKGYASKTLEATEDLIFDDLNCEMGVLLCADNLIPFYEKLNWYKVDCPVYFEQSTGEKLWKANTMLLSKKEKMNPQRIKLKGLPW